MFNRSLAPCDVGRAVDGQTVLKNLFPGDRQYYKLPEGQALGTQQQSLWWTGLQKEDFLVASRNRVHTVNVYRVQGAQECSAASTALSSPVAVVLLVSSTTSFPIAPPSTLSMKPTENHQAQAPWSILPPFHD